MQEAFLLALHLRTKAITRVRTQIVTYVVRKKGMGTKVSFGRTMMQALGLL